MRAAGALPTEQRVRNMNDAQWLWYYMNLQKDLEEDRDRWKNYLDYMGSYANPELAKIVANSNKSGSNNNSSYDNNTDFSDFENGDTTVSSAFEQELRNALAAEGLEEEDLIELPDSNFAGEKFESQEDFMARVMQLEDKVGTPFGIPQQPNKDIILNSVDPFKIDIENFQGTVPNILDPNDLDYFEEEDED